MLSRRRFLAGASILAATTALSRRSAWAGPDDPTPSWPAADWDTTRWGGPKRILEIFCYGGLSAWESFFVHTPFLDGPLGTNFRTTSLQPGCSAGGWVGDPSMPNMRNVGSVSNPLYWSIGTAPLVNRASMLSRTRVVAMSHPLFAHPVAIPRALTGRSLGDTRAFNIGAAMKKRYPGQNTSFVLMPPRSRFHPLDAPSFDAWMSVGMLGSESRPILVPMSGAVGDLSTWAARGGVDPARSDTLNAYYAEAYQQALFGSRSFGFDAYKAALDSLPGSPDLIGVFGSTLRREGSVVSHCSTNASDMTSRANTTAAQLDMAAWLYREKGTRYVGMVDVGIGTDTSAAYDGHTNTAGVTFGNMYRLLSELSRVVVDGTPGPGQIGLDETLIILNTEFGRTPDPEGSSGRDHWPLGYATVLIGGPVQPTASGRPKLVGGFDMMAGGIGTYTPENVACVALAAAGIKAELPGVFNNPDLPRPIPADGHFETPFFEAAGAP